MGTKDNHYVRDYTRKIFSKRVVSKSKKRMPSVLSISVDLMDKYSEETNVEKCETICKQKHKGCERKERKFYKYDDNHSLILEQPDKLPDTLQINNQFKKSSIPDTGKETENFLMQVEGEVIYKCYERGSWESCCCPIESYKEILACIFFFCPRILWCAILEEMEHMPQDIDGDVREAIVKCLDFYILLDKEVKKYGKEVCIHANDIALAISNSRNINGIEEVILEKKLCNWPLGDRVERIADISSKGIDLIFREINKQKWKKRYISKILGKDNYKYLSKNGLRAC